MVTQIKTTIILRHDTTDGWTTVENTAILKKGEMAIEFTATNEPKIKIGDGVKAWKDLPYFTVVLPTYYTWGMLRGISAENESGFTEMLGLKKPSFTDTVNVMDLNENYDKIESYSKELTDEINLVRAQVDAFVASYPDGIEGSADWEIQDVRRRYNNAVYQSAGAAVRAIDEDLQHLTEQTSEFIGSSAIDGLYREGDKLWVSSNGVPIGDPVEVSGGSGGGGGGGGSYYSIALTNLLDSRIISVQLGATVILEFSYSSVDADGYDDGPGVGSIIIGNVKRGTFQVPQGKNSLDVTKYLVAGENTVKIQVENSDGSYRSLSYTITLVSLSISTTFTDMSLYTGNVSFPYTVTGSGVKNVYFFMDGKKIGSEVITSSGRTYFFPIPVQEDGGHIFETYVETELDASTVRSNTLSIGMMWWSETMTDTAILMKKPVSSITQGETLSIPYLVYNQNSSENEITLTIIDENGEIYNEKNLIVDRTSKVWNTQDFPVGETIFQISSGRVIEKIVINTLKSSFSREIIASGLIFEVTAKGRSNTEANPEHWSYTITDDFGNTQTIEAQFEKFGWSNIDGWYEAPVDETNQEYQTVLRFLPNNYMRIPYAPFNRQTLKQTGMTVEMEFATHDVKDSETAIIASYKDNMGLIVKASSADLHSTANTVSARFKEDSKVRVTFIIEPETANHFIYIYINGIMCGVTQYTSADSFTQNDILTIGAESSGLDLYTLRFYSRALSNEEQMNNFICDRGTLAARIDAENRNNIFNDNGQITTETVPMTLPYIIMECEELPQQKGDKKKNKSMVFVDGLNPARSFTATGCEFDVQGTSSAKYPVKNYKIKLKSGITYTVSGRIDPDGFPIYENGISSPVLCLKADYASSENANNVMLVDYYEENTYFDRDEKGKEIPYPPTIKDKDAPGYIGYIDDRCRRAIRGFPIIVFWRNTTTNEIKFIGKYNCNDDKSDEIIYGFDREVIPKTECWEFKNNTSDRVVFKGLDFFEGEDRASIWSAAEKYAKDDIVIHNWNPYRSKVNDNSVEPSGLTLEEAWERIDWNIDLENDFEPRFPDTDPVYNDYSAFYRLCYWINSTDTSIDNSGTGLKISINGVEFDDTPDNRLKKFKEEFTIYFVEEATLFFYLFTEIFLMVDNRAKNMFLTTFDGKLWFPIPYDMDTAIGIFV